MSEKPMKILIADDEPMLREVIVEFLESLEGYELTEVENGIQALEYLRHNKVDCILSDMRMPEMGLEELIVILREEFPEVAVIATSGYSDLDNACSIFEQGASEFIGKPLDLDLLHDAIQWIPVRRDILQSAADLFGTEAPDDLPPWRDRLQTLAKEFDADFGTFNEIMQHARRTSKLASLFYDTYPADRIDRLSLAALLHEVGVSAIQLTVMKIPRPLLGNELRLARMRGKLGGRLIDQYLPDLGLGPIVADHFGWQDHCAGGEADDKQSAKNLTCLLGAINMIDSMLVDRSDRRGYEPAQVLQMFTQIGRKSPSPIIEEIIRHWDAIKTHYEPRA